MSRFLAVPWLVNTDLEVCYEHFSSEVDTAVPTEAYLALWFIAAIFHSYSQILPPLLVTSQDLPTEGVGTCLWQPCSL
jgi:hypothetical protein